MSRYRGRGSGQMLRQNIYESYWSATEVLQGLQNGQLCKGYFRVMPSSNDEAFVTTQSGAVILLRNMKDRNRTFHGDEVAVQIYPEEQWMVNIEEFTSYCKQKLGTLTEERALTLKRLTHPPADVDLHSSGASRSSNRDGQQRKNAAIKEITMTGDPTLISLLNNREQNSEIVQKTGKVVYVITRVRPRVVTGSLKTMKDNNRVALLQPIDRRFTAVKIQGQLCPPGFFSDPSSFHNILYKTQIIMWEEKGFLPMGSELHFVSKRGDVNIETQCIMMKHGLNDSNFLASVSESINQLYPWRIPASELAARKDLRDTCIFTIDSKVVNDIDDALSIEEVETGVYQVGVHIADVSYFVKENTELDNVVRARAVTVYLENKTLHMLPVQLSEDLCSLGAGKERLTFSVLWTMNEQGEILDEWIGRTVIKTCVNLTYEVARKLMDDSNNIVSEPKIHGPFSINDVIRRMQQLTKISSHLKEKRIKDGALILETVDVVYELEAQTGKPTGYKRAPERLQLVQEFMVLANTSVAQKICTHLPEKAILRIQPEPKETQLQKFAELCQSLGISMNVSSAQHLQTSISQFQGSDEESYAKWLALSRLLMRCLQKSKLVCKGTLYPGKSTNHYTLNISCYTDFTSPIRRYSDVLVHRLLAASLGDPSQNGKSKEELRKALDHYSSRNAIASSADTDSVELLLAFLIQERREIQEKAIVLAITDKTFEVLLINLNMTRRVFLEDLPVKVIKCNQENNGPPELVLEWRADLLCDRVTRHRITVLSRVDCKLVRKDELFKWSCLIKRPTEELSFDDY